MSGYGCVQLTLLRGLAAGEIRVTSRSADIQGKGSAIALKNLSARSFRCRKNVLMGEPEMTAQELFRAGQLADAIKALSAEVRDNPTDARRRTFLFELLCFAGEYERADKQLEVLGQAGPSSEIGVLLYRSALYAERQRQDLFTRGEFPKKLDASGNGSHRYVQWQAFQLFFGRRSQDWSPTRNICRGQLPLAPPGARGLNSNRTSETAERSVVDAGGGVAPRPRSKALNSVR